MVSNKNLRIILIANYLPDRQESMIRFAKMLEEGFSNAGHQTEVWRPQPIFGRWHKSTFWGLSKWVGYIDKWLIFPLVLSLRLQKKRYKNPNIRFHICDHSNAIYLKHFPIEQSSITCHDVIAIRSALGFHDTHTPTSMFGKFFQKWILNNLIKSRKIATNSKFVLDQLENIIPHPKPKNVNWRPIHLPFNADFKPLAHEKRKEVISKAGIPEDMPYILHVGSSEVRKNRTLLLHMANILGESWKGIICLAGTKFNEEEIKFINKYQLGSRVVSVLKPNHETLVALYSGAEAFIWPSFSEGFGWPLIEAQACGAPVISSNLAPMPEVSGGNSAIHADPHKPEEFVKAFLSLNDVVQRNELIKKGFENAKRFTPERILKIYLDLIVSNGESHIKRSTQKEKEVVSDNCLLP